MDTYEMIVRHYVWPADRRESLRDLARRFGLDAESTVTRRMDQFIDKLPTDNRGGETLLRLADLIRFSRAEK